ILPALRGDDAGARASFGAAPPASGAPVPSGTGPAAMENAPRMAGTARLEEAIRAGRVRALVLLGPAQAGGGEGGPPPLGSALRARLDEVVLLDAFETPLVPAATAVLPTLAFGEFEGTYTTFEGRVQRVRAALGPHADAWPSWRVLQELGRRLAG